MCLADAIHSFKWMKIIRICQDESYGFRKQRSCLIEISTHLKLCLADAIHNFKWVKIIQICQDVGWDSENNQVD